MTRFGSVPEAGPVHEIDVHECPSYETQAWPSLLTARKIVPFDAITPSGPGLHSPMPHVVAPSGPNLLSACQVLPPSVDSSMPAAPGADIVLVWRTIPSRPKSRLAGYKGNSTVVHFCPSSDHHRSPPPPLPLNAVGAPSRK